MRLLGIALFAVSLAVMAGYFISEDPGFVVIGYGGKVVRMTFALFILIAILLTALLYVLSRLFAGIFGIKRRWGQWLKVRGLRRAHHSLARGILASAKGDFPGAERLFRRGAKEGVQPEAHYLAAANVAQEMNASARRDKYLQLAHDAEPSVGVALDIKRAECLLESDELDRAETLINSLEKTEVGNASILELRAKLLGRVGDMRTLLDLIPDLRRNRVVPFDEIDLLERNCVIAIIDDKHGSVDALRDAWGELPRPIRQLTPVLVRYVRRLCAFEVFDEAEALVRSRLESIWDSSLAGLYGEIDCDPPTRQLSQADTWAISHKDDPDLLLTRARLTVRAGLWVQAEDHLKCLLKNGPTPLLYHLQANVAEAVGEGEIAADLRKDGLALATNGNSVATGTSAKRTAII